MPGTVTAVQCAVGDAVREGDALLTLEAMKMETVVRAPHDGVVREIAVDAKQAVHVEDLLAVVSAAE